MNEEFIKVINKIDTCCKDEGFRHKETNKQMFEKSSMHRCYLCGEYTIKNLSLIEAEIRISEKERINKQLSTQKEQHEAEIIQITRDRDYMVSQNKILKERHEAKLKEIREWIVENVYKFEEDMSFDNYMKEYDKLVRE